MTHPAFHIDGAAARLTTVALAAVIGVVAGCTPQRRVPVTMSAPTVRQWSEGRFTGTEIRTEHWVIHTTSTQPYWIEALPVFVEGCYAQYQHLVPAPANSRALKLYVFETALQLDAFAAMVDAPRDGLDQRSNLGGFAHKGLSAVYIQQPGETLRAIAHTGMQQYLWYHAASDLPTWVSQGLSVLAEGFDQRDGRFVFEPRYNYQRYSQARVAFQKGWLMDLEALIEPEGRLGDTPNPTVAAQTYLAQLWAMMALLQRKPHEEGFEQLRRDITSDAFALKVRGYIAASEQPLSPAEAAFRLYVTEDLAAFRRAYRNHLVKSLNLVPL